MPNGVACAGHGTCNNNYDSTPVTCACETGWVGADCSVCEPAMACGNACCTMVGEVCLAGSCVVPGVECTIDVECTVNEYCELALGAPSTPACPPAAPGRCAPQPPTCTSPGNPVGCIDGCTRQVGSGGPITTAVKWRWGYETPPTTFPASVDVWATPTVARINDADCDGVITRLDPPNVAFVSGNAEATFCGAPTGNCKDGVLRLLDGPSGEEIWSLDKVAGSVGFAGTSVAVGDVTGDGLPDIIALTGEGRIAVISGAGAVLHVSTDVVSLASLTNFGWGGALALGDMNHDGWPEIAFGPSLFTMNNGTLSLLFHGGAGVGATNRMMAISYFVDLTGDGTLELLAGNTAYTFNGSLLWSSGTMPDGFTAVADLGGPAGVEVVHVAAGSVPCPTAPGVRRISLRRAWVRSPVPPLGSARPTTTQPGPCRQLAFRDVNNFARFCGREMFT